MKSEMCPENSVHAMILILTLPRFSATCSQFEYGAMLIVIRQ